MNRCIGALALLCAAMSLVLSLAIGRAHAMDPDWRNWSDQSFAPPGWDCTWQHELDAGECEALPGWVMVFDEVLRENILIRPAHRALDTAIARD